MRGTIAIVLVACSGSAPKTVETPRVAADASVAAPPDAAPKPTADAPSPPTTLDALLARLPEQDFAPPLTINAGVTDDAKKQSVQLNIAGLVLHRKQDFAGAETKYLAALAADPGNLIARYNLACVYNRSNRSPQGLRLLVELATLPGCDDCIKVVDHARWDDEWQSQWAEDVFWRVLEQEEAPAGANDSPTPTCPKGTKLHGKWSDDVPENEVYCAKGKAKQGPYHLREEGYSMGEGERELSGSYDKGKKQGLWDESESYGHSTFGAYVAGVPHGLWIDHYKDDTAYAVYVGGVLDGRQRTYRSTDGDADVLVSDETYDHGKKNGTFATWDDTGNKRSLGTWDHDQPSGKFQYWSSDGKLLGETTIDHGTGDWIAYDETDALTARGKLVDGVADGKWGEQDGGWFEGEYAKGKRTGTWTRYDSEGGAKNAEGAYANGQRTGAWTYWTTDGKLRAKGGFAGGALDGAWEVHGDDDTVQNVVFKKGKLVKVDGKRATKGMQRYVTQLGFADNPMVIEDADQLGMPEAE